MARNTVCLCGSLRFLDDFHAANQELTKRGFSVITISLLKGQAPTHSRDLTDLVHLNKILRSDAVFVVGPGYVGRATAREILWAEMQGKPVVAQAECSGWDEAEQRIRSGTDTHLCLKAREVLGLL